MKKHDAVAALAALAQDNRLDVFRLLVEAGPEGLAAGSVANALKLAPNTLTFHFDRLRAGETTLPRPPLGLANCMKASFRAAPSWSDAPSLLCALDSDTAPYHAARNSAAACGA